VLAVRLSAVDAPLWASAETVDGSGAVTPLTGALAAEAQLVYAATPLADGATALVRHRLGGGVAIVRRAADGAERVLTDLDGAASVDVSPDGTALTWLGGGTRWLASMNRVGEAIAIGDGSRARFSPDGSLLLVSGPDGAIIIDRSGNLIDAVGPGACWIGGGRGCRP
jgi:hypothetical protein